nr:hypothetical protein L7610.11 - Leishmania major [Leishmania major]
MCRNVTLRIGGWCSVGVDLRRRSRIASLSPLHPFPPPSPTLSLSVAPSLTHTHYHHYHHRHQDLSSLRHAPQRPDGGDDCGDGLLMWGGAWWGLACCVLFCDGGGGSGEQRGDWGCIHRAFAARLPLLSRVALFLCVRLCVCVCVYPLCVQEHKPQKPTPTKARRGHSESWGGRRAARVGTATVPFSLHCGGCLSFLDRLARLALDVERRATRSVIGCVGPRSNQPPPPPLYSPSSSHKRNTRGNGTCESDAGEEQHSPHP